MDSFLAFSSFWEDVFKLVEAARLAQVYPPEVVPTILAKVDLTELCRQTIWPLGHSDATGALAFRVLRHLASDSGNPRPRFSTSLWQIIHSKDRTTPIPSGDLPIGVSQEAAIDELVTDGTAAGGGLGNTD